MLGTRCIDGGNQIDWGKTSEDYARFRPGPPGSFYQKLQALGVGLEDQEILDLGTGTGLLARQFARQGCQVVGADISSEQIQMADSLTKKEGLSIEYHVAATEDLKLDGLCFDVIAAIQCYLYFNPIKAIPAIKRLLKPDGVFVTSHFSWMPFLDPVAMASEKLILKFNPQWSAHSYKGEFSPYHGGLEEHFRLKGFFFYDEGIPFTHESWRGRIRACRGVGASLNPDQVAEFDQAHETLLNQIVTDPFEVIHRVDAHIFIPLEHSE